MRKQLFCVFLWLMLTATAYAQSNSSNSAVYIDLNTGFLFSNNKEFGNTWRSFPALHANIQIPFYASRVEAGVRFTRYNGYTATEPDADFSSFYFYVGYGYPFKITSWYNLMPVFRLGRNLMLFDESAVYVNNDASEKFITDQSESEIAYELVLRNQLKITNRWFLNAELSYNHTFTYHPIPVTLFTIGVSYSFSQPHWLQDIIQ